MSIIKAENMKDGRLKNWRWWTSLIVTLLMVAVAIVIAIPVMIFGVFAATFVNSARYGWLSKLVDLPTKYAVPMHNWWRKSQGLKARPTPEPLSQILRETVEEILH